MSSLLLAMASWRVRPCVCGGCYSIEFRIEKANRDGSIGWPIQRRGEARENVCYAFPSLPSAIAGRPGSRPAASMVLPHDVRLAAENALKSLKADALKVAAKGGPEALRAAEAAQMEGQLPLALGDSTDPDSNRTRGHAALLHRSTD